MEVGSVSGTRCLTSVQLEGPLAGSRLGTGRVVRVFVRVKGFGLGRGSRVPSVGSSGGAGSGFGDVPQVLVLLPDRLYFGWRGYRPETSGSCTRTTTSGDGDDTTVASTRDRGRSAHPPTHILVSGHDSPYPEGRPGTRSIPLGRPKLPLDVKGPCPGAGGARWTATERDPVPQVGRGHRAGRDRR